jgi:hypothetical protein
MEDDRTKLDETEHPALTKSNELTKCSVRLLVASFVLPTLFSFAFCLSMAPSMSPLDLLNPGDERMMLTNNLIVFGPGLSGLSASILTHNRTLQHNKFTTVGKWLSVMITLTGIFVGIALWITP